MKITDGFGPITQLVMTTDVISNGLFAGSIPVNQIVFREMHCGKKTFKFSVFINAYGISSSISAISAFEMLLLDAITTISLSGSKSFSTSRVNRVLSGTEKTVLTNAKARLINTSILRLKSLSITIEDVSSNRFGKNTQSIDCKQLMPVKEIQPIEDLEENVVYKITDFFPIYQFANSMNHVCRVPISINRVPVSDTETSLIVRAFLLRKILMITRGRKMNRSITFTAIYDALSLDLETVSDNALFRIRKMIFSILDYYTCISIKDDQSSFISGYEVVGHGKMQYEKIEILK